VIPWQRLRWAAVLVAVVLVGIQWVPVERTNPAVTSEVMVSPEVRDLLVRACFDCHSHQTVWPWYSRVAPVSWWVASHIRKGRADLNFSEWPVFDAEEAQRGDAAGLLQDRPPRSASH